MPNSTNDTSTSNHPATQAGNRLPRTAHPLEDTHLTIALLIARYKARVYERFHTHYLTAPLGTLPNPAEKPSIVVIEDNADEWLLTQWALRERFAQAELIWLSTTQEVRQYLTRGLEGTLGVPRLILLDLYLPTAKEGLALMDWVKSHPCFKQVPLITLSRSSDPADISQAFEQASQAYIIKPQTFADWQEAFSLLERYW